MAKPRPMPEWYIDLVFTRSAKTWLDTSKEPANVVAKRHESRTVMGRRLDDWRAGPWRSNREMIVFLRKLNARREHDNGNSIRAVAGAYSLK